MGTEENLLSRMNTQYHKFSKGQKKLVSYITDNYDKAAFFTAAKLGETVGVSESTVVRFAIHLGYKGYPEFQKALEELVRNKLNSIQRMEVTYGRVPQSEILDTVLRADIEKIKLTMENIDHNAFELAVETILEAKSIYIVGIRSCAPLASFLGFYFNLLFDNVHLMHTNSSSELFEQMIHISKDDVIIGISFPRYSMRTLKALEFANNRNAKVITLTDSIHSPMNLYSSCNLIARSDMASIVDSLVAPLSVINALVVALCMRKQKEVTATLEDLEKRADILKNAIRVLDGKVAYVCINKEEKVKKNISYEEIHPISSILRDCADIELGFTMYEEEPDRWRCSFRSDGKWIDVNELITPFGGGGHAGAAGLRKRTSDMEELRSQILEKVKKLRAEKCFT